MPGPGLTALQRRVLGCLAGSKPPWTLTGGGALVGFHLRHRATRDLDLFWHGREELGDEREGCIRRLRGDGLAGGTDLVRALGDAPRKDGGFSVMTLAWVLRGLPIEELADAAGIDAADRESLSLYRDAMVDDLLLRSRPAAE